MNRGQLAGVLLRKFGPVRSGCDLVQVGRYGGVAVGQNRDFKGRQLTARLIVSQILVETLEALGMTYLKTSPERLQKLATIRLALKQ